MFDCLKKKPLAKKSFSEMCFEVASKEIGHKELPGSSKDNPEIIKYWDGCKVKYEHDEVPWCAAFVNWVTMVCGIPGTRSGLAKSFVNWGVTIPLEKTIRGDVVVVTRPGGNHVAFAAEDYSPEWKKKGVFPILGGNQSNQVCIKDWSLSRHLKTKRAAV